MTKAEAGRLGGLAVVKKYGHAYMSEIGKRGFEATTELYFNGDPQAHVNWLVKMGMYVADTPYRERGWPSPFRWPGNHPAHEQPF